MRPSRHNDGEDVPGKGCHEDDRGDSMDLAPQEYSSFQLDDPLREGGVVIFQGEACYAQNDE